jgi:hypothetical protein
MRPHTTTATTIIGLAAVLSLSAGCPDFESLEAPEEFPRVSKSMLPPGPWTLGYSDDPDWQVSTGIFTGVGPEQPIEFPHYRHVTELGMECEYCHTMARKSIHSGVPETQTCVNCHQYVMSVKDTPEIQKVLDYYERQEPIPWKKVHDLPDYVHFTHKRHVQAGVNCTECHGQVGLQGQVTTWSEDDGHGSTVQKTGIEHVMIRETSLQMGWCLDCHGSHPSIDKNYGDKADLRRAELKDCWTCHK